MQRLEKLAKILGFLTIILVIGYYNTNTYKKDIVAASYQDLFDIFFNSYAITETGRNLILTAVLLVGLFLMRNYNEKRINDAEKEWQEKNKGKKPKAD
jgi:preprotein translocase subunit SecG